MRFRFETARPATGEERTMEPGVRRSTRARRWRLVGIALCLFPVVAVAVALSPEGTGINVGRRDPRFAALALEPERRLQVPKDFSFKIQILHRLRQSIHSHRYGARVLVKLSYGAPFNGLGSRDMNGCSSNMRRLITMAGISGANTSIPLPIFH